MSEDMTSKPAETTNQNSDSTDSSDSNSVAREDYEALQKANASLGHELRKITREFKSFRAEIDAKKTDAAEKSGDVEELKKSYEARLTEERTGKDAALNRLRNYALRDLFRASAKKYVLEDALDDVWNLTSAEFDLVEDEKTGKERIVMSDKSAYSSIDEFIKDFIGKRPYYAVNPRKPGTGAAGGGDNKGKAGGGKISADELANMSATERQQALLKDPSLRNSLFEKMTFEGLSRRRG